MTREQARRRGELIDKDIDGPITDAERAELDELERVAAEWAAPFHREAMARLDAAMREGSNV